MRIKKKHVLIESNLLSSLGEFSPQEKRLLFVLNKEYGPHDYHTFNIWEASAFLIELFEIPYDLAYEMSTTYYYNGKKLFDAAESLRKRINPSEILFRYLSDMTKNLKKYLINKSISEDDENVGRVNINFQGDNFGKWKTQIEDRSMLMWENSYGFTLYIPLRNTEIGEWPNRRYLYSKDADPRLIMVSITIQPIKIPTELEYGWDGDPDNVKVNVELRVGNDDGDGGYKVNDWMSFEVPLPKPLSKENILKTLTDIYNDVLEKIKSSTFELPNGVEPIIISDD